MYCRLTKTAFTPVLPRDVAVPQYPSEFFAAKKGKPTLQIPLKGCKMDQIRGMVRSGIILSKLDVQLAIKFVYEVLKKEKGTLVKKWESFDNTIGNSGEDVTVFQMFEIEEIDTDKPDGQGAAVETDEDDLWMVMWILFQYRMARTIHAEHRNAVSSKLTVAIQGINPTAPAIPAKAVSTATWLSNPNYTKMIAGIDMFFNMFKQHPLSTLRMGTLPSRYKDCAALLGLSQMSDVTGMDEKQIIDWIFVGTVGQDVLCLMKEGQEIEKPTSYTPYLMDMGLSNKSPYSATQCSAFYNFCHITCTLLHSTRSKHARLINENNINDISANAKIIAYVIGMSLNLVKAFTANASDKVMEPGDFKIPDTGNDDGQSEVFDPDSEVPMPETRNALDWFNYLVQTDCKLPEAVNLATQRLARRLGTTRDGTIGKFVDLTMS
ncbi:nucleoprotein [Aruac virus]|uniref:Nucleoprotein n=1 Tax=Aruac virus TaxID=1272961 RepID=A0A0D3R1D3_9RHAB|nr:nucleoprotein [Aruac virus]AJR28312.1 nucleoprotein [Aruac virus]